jgi:tRNA A37 N6-isopentenylltransferase MiaA
VRQAIEQEMEHLGSEALYQKLIERDSDYAATITKNDRQKVIRALEIITLADCCCAKRDAPNNISAAKFRVIRIGS